MSRQVQFPTLPTFRATSPSYPFFAFPPPESPHANTSSSMDSDTKFNTTVYETISQFNNSDIETPDELANSELSPSTFSRPPFQPLRSRIKIESPSTSSSITDVRPTYSPLTSANNFREVLTFSKTLLYNFKIIYSLTILSTIIQLAHEELFKLINSSFNSH